jgi:hypothetical protein
VQFAAFIPYPCRGCEGVNPVDLHANRHGQHPTVGLAGTRFSIPVLSKIRGMHIKRILERVETTDPLSLIQEPLAHVRPRVLRGIEPKRC